MKASSVEKSIERHLGLPLGNPFRNHYELLQISPDAKTSEIKQALKGAAAKWNASDRKSNPESALLVANLLKQAQNVLLDEHLRTQYDQALFASTSVAAPAAHGNESSARDLFRAFDPIESSAWQSDSAQLSSFVDADQRWQELKQAIPNWSDPPLEFFPMNPAAAGRTLPPDYPPAIPPASQTPPQNRSKEIMRIEQMKRARKNKNRLFLAGIFTVAFLFLGFAGVKFLWNRDQVLRNAEVAKANVDTVAAGLKANASESDRVLGGNPVREPQQEPSKSKEPIRSGLPTLSQDTGADPLSEMAMQNDAAVNMDPFAAPAMPEAVPMTPAAPEKPMMASTKEWAVVMKEARSAVERGDFPGFHKQMELAIPLSKTDDMIAKQARLDQLGQLYEIFINSLKDSKSKLWATEVLVVGKRKINIVEITATELIIRVEGKNEKYAWDQLPLGIALALADLTLNDLGPTDLAARAVYCSLSPAKNELYEKRAREFFEKSVGKGEIRADLPQALTDTYE